MPQPVRDVKLPNYTSAYPEQPGCKYSGYLSCGVPLHYAIPQAGFDCSSGASGSYDLPPGQYVVPFAITVLNDLHQQAPASPVQLWASDLANSDGMQAGSGDLQVTGQAGSALTWESDGSCAGWTLNAGGQNTQFGFIGPATASQLADAHVYAAWGHQAARGGSASWGSARPLGMPEPAGGCQRPIAYRVALLMA